MTAQSALQEDADAIGLSILSGAHLTLFSRIFEGLRGRASRTTLIGEHSPERTFRRPGGHYSGKRGGVDVERGEGTTSARGVAVS